MISWSRSAGSRIAKKCPKSCAVHCSTDLPVGAANSGPKPVLARLDAREPDPRHEPDAGLVENQGHRPQALNRCQEGIEELSSTWSARE